MSIMSKGMKVKQHMILKIYYFLWSNMINIVPILPLRFSSPFLLFLKLFLKIFLNKFLKKNTYEQFSIIDYTYK